MILCQPYAIHVNRGSSCRRCFVTFPTSECHDVQRPVAVEAQAFPCFGLRTLRSLSRSHVSPGPGKVRFRSLALQLDLQMLVPQHQVRGGRRMPHVFFRHGIGFRSSHVMSQKRPSNFAARLLHECHGKPDCHIYKKNIYIYIYLYDQGSDIAIGSAKRIGVAGWPSLHGSASSVGLRPRRL